MIINFYCVCKSVGNQWSTFYFIVFGHLCELCMGILGYAEDDGSKCMERELSALQRF